jgi:hypothetical protein
MRPAKIRGEERKIVHARVLPTVSSRGLRTEGERFWLVKLIGIHETPDIHSCTELRLKDALYISIIIIIKNSNDLLVRPFIYLLRRMVHLLFNLHSNNYYC